MTRILVVEDDPDIAGFVRRGLIYQEYEVDVASDGEEGLAVARDRPPDLVLLDLMIPKIDGAEVCRRLRKESNVPIIILTARDSVTDKISGLDAGADDYVLKPYDLNEVLARIRALARRASGRAEPVYEHKGVTVNPASREVTVEGVSVLLSAREWAVLEPLLARPGRVLSRTQLEEKLYSWKDEISSNAVEVYIHGLRKKLGADVIRNVRGVGYMVPKA